MKYTAVRWKKRDRRKKLFDHVCEYDTCTKTILHIFVISVIWMRYINMYMYIYIYNERYSETESVKKREIERERNGRKRKTREKAGGELPWRTAQRNQKPGVGP